MLTYEALCHIRAQAEPIVQVDAHLNLYSLHDYALIRVAGVDAEKFLQGQLTCDCRRLAQGDVLLGAHCNVKGRMISSFWAAQHGPDILLQLHGSVLNSALAALKKYAVFSKVQLSIVEDRSAIAFEGAAALEQLSSTFTLPTVGQTALGQECLWLRLSTDIILCWGASEALKAIITQVEQCLHWHPSNQWDRVLVAKGWAEVRTETAEAFIPQEFNFHARDGVSFKKGCYTGQEIVARMQYLGKQKKHLYAGYLQGDASHLRIGEALHIPSKNDAQGHVVAVAEGGAPFLAVVNDAAIEEGSLHFKPFADVKISWQALPYAIP